MEGTGMKNTKLHAAAVTLAITVILCTALLTGSAAADTVGGNEPLSRDNILIENQDLMMVVMPPGKESISLGYASPDVPEVFNDKDGGNPNVQWGGPGTNPPYLPNGEEYLTVKAVYGRGPAENGAHRLAVAGVNKSSNKFTLRVYAVDVNNSDNPLSELYSLKSGMSSPSTGFDKPYNPAVDIMACDWNCDNVSDYIYVFPTDEEGYKYNIGVTDGNNPSGDISSITIADAPNGTLVDPPYSITRCADLALADIDGDGRKEVVVIAKENDGTIRLHAYSVDNQLNISEYNSSYKVADWKCYGAVCAVESGNSRPGGIDELYVLRYANPGTTITSDSLTRLSLISATAWEDGSIEWREKASGKMYNSLPFPEMYPENWVDNPLLGQLAVGDINGDGQDECCVLNLIDEHGSREFDGYYYIEGLWIMIFNVEDGNFVIKSRANVITMPDIGYFSLDRFNYASLALGAFGGKLDPAKNNVGIRQFILQLNPRTNDIDNPEIDDNWRSNIVLTETEIKDNGNFGFNPSSWEDFGNTREREFTCLVPGDFAGKSLRLGTPAKITLANNISPQVIVQEPPKHIDYIQNTDTGVAEMCNVSRLASFKTVFKEKGTSSSMVDSEQKTDFSYGTSTSVSGNPGLEMEVFKASETLEATFSESREKTEDINNEKYKNMSTSISVGTTNGDEVLYRRSKKVLWRYPVLNRTDENGEPVYVQVVVPEPTQGMQKIGRDASWYQPPHISGNLLTYPWKKEQLSYGYFNLSSSDQIASGNMMGLDNATIWDVNWTEDIRKKSTVSTTVKSKRSASMSASMGGSYDGFLGGLKAGVNYFSDSCFEDTTSNRNTISSEEGFTVDTPGNGFNESNSWGYQIEPCVYSTDIGVIATTFIAQPGETINQENWWNERYGQHPNPALGLPHQWRKKSSSGDKTQWEWDTQIGAKELRGMFFYGNDKKIGPTLEKNIFSEVNIKCRVYNLAIGETNRLEGVEVKFYYTASDNNYSPYEGEKHLIGSERVNIETWGKGNLPNWTMAEVNWDIEDLDQGYYFIHVEVDPEDEVKEMALHDNGDEFSDNKGYFCTYVYGNSKSGGSNSTLEILGELNIEGKILNVSPENPALGQAVTVNAGITNTSASAHAVDLFATIYDEGPEGKLTMIADEYIPGIMPGTTYPLNNRYFPEGEGIHKLSMVIDSISGEEEAETTQTFLLGESSNGGCIAGHLPPSFLLLLAPFYFMTKKR